MDVIEWRSVSAAPGYEVSSAGVVRSLDRIAHGGGRRIKGRVLRQFVTHMGYSRVTIFNASERLYISTHTLVAEAFIGPRPPGKQVNHIDGNKLNNTPSNLEYVTPSENAIHAYGLGLRVGLPGETNGAAKLNERDIEDIYDLRDSGWTLEQIGGKYGITFQTASSIVNRKTWKHVQPDRILRADRDGRRRKCSSPNTGTPSSHATSGAMTTN
jgi:hypothetical protein